jgi:hypothetical protein
MQIPTELVKDGRAAQEALVKDMSAVEATVAKEESAFKTIFIDFLPQIVAVAFITLVIGLVAGAEIGKHLHVPHVG